MKLYLDTTDNTKTVIKINDKLHTRTTQNPREQDVFGFLTSVFTEEGITPSEITEIYVNEGPGSFTGTRIGVAIANSLGFALNLPVNNQPVPVSPVYSQPPNITKSKKSLVS